MLEVDVYILQFPLRDLEIFFLTLHNWNFIPELRTMLSFV